MAPKKDIPKAASSADANQDEVETSTSPVALTEDYLLQLVLAENIASEVSASSDDDISAIIAGLKNLNIKVGDTIKSLKVIEKEKNKEVNETLKKERADQRAEERKMIKARLRERKVRLTIQHNDKVVVLTVKLATTIGHLRHLVAQELGLAKAMASKMTLTLNGKIVSESPRKTLLGVGIFADAVLSSFLFGQGPDDVTEDGIALEGIELEENEDDLDDDDDETSNHPDDNSDGLLSD